MYKKMQFFICLALVSFSFLGANENNQTKEKQILHINFLEGAPKFIHPHLSRDTNGLTLCKALFEGLTRINLQGDLELAIAEKIVLSKCKTKYTIYLKPSFWADGKQLTAHHFVRAWKKAIHPETTCLHPYRFFMIKNAEKAHLKQVLMSDVGIYAPKKNIIVVHLEHPTPYFTQLLADPIYSPLMEDTSTDFTQCNGPFVLGTFQPNKKITLKKNLLYWDKETVQLDGIDISLIRDAQTVYKLFQKGQIDFVGSPFSDLPEEVIQNREDIKRCEIYSSYLLHINVHSPKLFSKNIRKALSLSLDREHLAQFILPNATPCPLILPKALSFLKTPFIDKESDIQKIFSQGLQEIGCTRENFSLTLSYSATSRHALLAEYLKYQWEKNLNIQVVLKKNDWNTFYGALNAHDFEIGGYAKSSTYPDGIYFLEYFYDANMNHGKWQNSLFQKWIDLANQTTSEKKRKKYLAKAEKILQDELPVIPVYTHNHLYLCNKSIKNFVPMPLAYSDFKWVYFEDSLSD